jgi:predicted RNA-binding Zn-ribbon protein involved in translation (DUF1610 family)
MISNEDISVKVSILGVNTTIPPNGNLTNVDKDTKITINFPVDINKSTLKVTLSDGVILELMNYDNNTNTAFYKPFTTFLAGRTYSIFLGSGLKDSSDQVILDQQLTWNFTTSPTEEKYILILGPFMDDNNNPVEGAIVTITIQGAPFFDITNNTGYFVFDLPKTPTPGSYSVKVISDDYEGISYNIIIDEQGKVDQGEIPQIKKIGDELDYTGLYIIISIVVIVVIILIIVFLILRGPRVVDNTHVTSKVEKQLEEAEEFRCPACGASVIEEEKVCLECGEEFEFDEYKCPECSTVIEPNATSCDYCGEEFERPHQL